MLTEEIVNFFDYNIKDIFGDLMFNYIMYDCIIASTHECRFLTPITSHIPVGKKIITIRFNLIDSQNYRSKKFQYIYNDYYFKGKWDGTTFVISWNDFSIDVETDSVDRAFLLVLNIPIALLLSYDNKIVLHCSCVLNEKKIHAFSGKKGVGKSTISSLLVAHNGTLFSDDTICIDVLGERVCSNYYVIKYSKESEISNSNFLKCTDIKPIYITEDKKVFKLDYFGEDLPLNTLSIKYLFRGSQFELIEISDINLSAEMMLSNNVGYKYAPKYIKETLYKNINKLYEKNNIKNSILLMPHLEPSNINSYIKSIIKQIY